MIRINLLGANREAVKKKAPLQAGQKLTAACALILVLAGGFVGWRFWTIGRDSARHGSSRSSSANSACSFDTHAG